MLKKLLLSSLVFIFILSGFLSFFPKKAMAQANPWYSQDFRQWYTKVYDTNISPPSEIFGERYTAAQVQWVLYSLPSITFNTLASFISSNPEGLVLCVINADLGSCISAFLGDNSFQSQTRLAQQKSVPETLFGNRSLSGVGYIREKLSKPNIVPEAEAQVGGFGFGALNPIQNIWRAFRDITYGFFIIIIIAMAFMIMFRVKLSPQTVITVQSALPKIVVGLILVTFSYAIAGFVVDLVYVAIGLLALIIVNTNLTSLMGTDWSNVFGNLTYGPGEMGILSFLFHYWGWFMLGTLQAWFGLDGIGMGFANIFLSIGQLVGGILALIFAFLSILIMLWAGLKTVFMLIKTYVVILILVIFAPFQIALGIIYPGAGVGFGPWLRSLAANLAVYPMVGIMLTLSFMFLSASGDWADIISSTFHGGPASTDVFSGNAWYPPLTFGLQNAQYDPLPILWLYASLGIMVMIPKAGEIIQSAISGRPFGFGTAIGQAMGPVMWVGGQARGWGERNVGGELGKKAQTRAYGPGAPQGVRGYLLRSGAGIAERRGWIIKRSGQGTGFRRPGES